MPTYNVIISGSGIDLPAVEDPIAGFATTRRVQAPDEQVAMERAKRAVAREWREGGYQERNRASIPVLDVEGVERLSWWRALTTRSSKHGFTFHTITQSFHP